MASPQRVHVAFAAMAERPILFEHFQFLGDKRNQIVHEGDYERLERPQTAKSNPITQAEAVGHVDFVAGLINAIHSVA